jgi:hypothetical protein
MNNNEMLVGSENNNEFIHNHLGTYNRQFMADFKDYNYYIKKSGKIIPGIIAERTFNSLEIKFLFVYENHSL